MTGECPGSRSSSEVGPAGLQPTVAGSWGQGVGEDITGRGSSIAKGILYRKQWEPINIF